VDFYSLQKGEPGESELAELIAGGWNGLPLVDFTRELHDFSDTAALLANLDLLISVDTAAAHLAGALGKPVWILNRFDACWRWLLHRSDSPWYPTARLYRQERPGDWDSVVSKVAADLRAKVGASGARLT
jgi:ADP-heptose:LPS heptosyltransferase